MSIRTSIDDTKVQSDDEKFNELQKEGFEEAHYAIKLFWFFILKACVSIFKRL